MSRLSPFPLPVCPPRSHAALGSGRLARIPGEGRECLAWGIFFFHWEHAYFLIGLGVNEWIRSVWSEQGWALVRVI